MRRGLLNATQLGTYGSSRLLSVARWFLVLAWVTVCLGMVSNDASGSSSASTFITCHEGTTPGSGPQMHPRRCIVFGVARGGEGWGLILINLRWHHWGAGRTLARGFSVNPSIVNPETFKRSSVSVSAYAKVSCDTTASSYTKLRLAGRQGGAPTLSLASCEPRG
jgi:hypothetical protein